MTKEEKIKEAYGEYWEQLTDSAKFSALNNNGWLHYNNIVNEKGTLLDALDMDFLSDIDVFRPKSLQGIEHNNNWIKIESEADLPKEDCKLHVYPNYLEMDIFFFYNDELSRDELITNHTHYQQIEKPKPPLF